MIASTHMDEIPSQQALFSEENPLENFRMEDVLSAQAYEDTPAFLRARLKTAIAFQGHMGAESPTLETRTLTHASSGFQYGVQEQAAAWALAIIDPMYSSPARLLAALIPAVLAGVKHLFVVSLFKPLSSSLLVALELAGLEDIFILPRDTTRAKALSAPALLSALYEANSQGRLLLFPTQSKEEAFEELANTARHLRLPYWQDTPCPRLLLPCPDTMDNGVSLRDIVQWAHGDALVFGPEQNSAQCSEQNSPSGPSGYDACFGQTQTQKSFLTLGPGLELCWCNLTVSFFRTRLCQAHFLSHPTTLSEPALFSFSSPIA